MFIQLRLDVLQLEYYIAKLQRQDISLLLQILLLLLFLANSITIFDCCVTHEIVSYLNRSKFNCFIRQRSVQARHRLLYDPLRFSAG